MRRGLFAGRRDRMAPHGIRSALAADEAVLAAARTDAGEALAATRFGLWVTDDPGDPGERWGWELISKATLDRGVLSVVRATVVETWPDATAVLRDDPARTFAFAQPTGLTDVVHARVRGSVRIAERLDGPGPGGWVVLRRIPGRDGLVTQFRLDPAARLDGPGAGTDDLAAAVARRAADLRARVGSLRP